MNKEINILDRIIGAGAGFPIELTPLIDNKGEPILGEDGELQMGWNVIRGDFNLIDQSLKNIIFTMLGSRIRQENFGSRLYELIEEPNNQIVTFLSSKYVTEAVRQWEPRIQQITIEAIPKNERLSIKASYRLVDPVSQGENEIEFTYPE